MSLSVIALLLVIGTVVYLLFRKTQTTTDTSIKETDVPGKSAGYQHERMKVWGYTILMYIGIILVVFTYWPEGKDRDPVTGTLFFILFLFIASWRIIDATEQAVLKFLGRAICTLGPGLQFVPFPLCTIVKFTTLFIDDDLPVHESKIHRVKLGEAETVPLELQEKGYRPPLRVQFAGIESEEASGKVTGVSDAPGTSGQSKGQTKKQKSSKDPLSERVTTEVPGFVRWRVIDALKFYTTIGSIDSAREQMADLYSSLITRELPQVTLAQCLADRGTYDGKVLAALSDLTSTWGVQVATASIKEIPQSHTLNAAIQKMAESSAKQRSNILEGVGLGEREKGILVGRGDGLAHLKEKTGLEAEVILASETARDVAEKVDTLVAVGQGGIADMMGIVAAGSQVFKAASKPKNNDPAKPQKGGAP